VFKRILVFSVIFCLILSFALPLVVNADDIKAKDTGQSFQSLQILNSGDVVAVNGEEISQKIFYGLTSVVNSKFKMEGVVLAAQTAAKFFILFIIGVYLIKKRKRISLAKTIIKRSVLCKKIQCPNLLF